MNFCPQCRTPLDAGARFCANCGHTLPAQASPGAAQGPRPFAGTPQGYAPQGSPPGHAPPAAPAYGPPPGAPPPHAAPYAPGHAPHALGALPAAPPADEGGGLKVLGGCGLAGCLGVGFAVLVGIGLIIVIVVIGGSSSSGSASGPSSGVPSSGSIRSIVRPNVGQYRLVGTTPLEKVPPGVVDSIGAIYTSPGGTQIRHVLLVYPSEAVAAERIRNVMAAAISGLQPGQKVSSGDLTNNENRVIGTIISVTGRDPESFYWNNRKLVVIVDGPAPHAKAFSTSTSY